MSHAVNFVWNYCNETGFSFLKNKYKWLSAFDLIKLTSGCGAALGISSVTIQCVCQEYVSKRVQSRKAKLKWRSNKKNLGWIPMKWNCVRVVNDTVIYAGHTFKFWKSRDICGDLKTAHFSQDSRGRWYVTLQCELKKQNSEKTGKEIGLDLGLKTIASGSGGEKYERENITKKYEDKLAMARRARKKRLARTIHAKIKNSRKDWAHKTTTKIIKSNDLIVVGDVSSSAIKKTKLAKSTTDAGWCQIKTMLEYKAIRLGKEYINVNEKFSTVTCSVCFNKTSMGGLSGLGVREWKCEGCGITHDRDTNAAINILRFGHESLERNSATKIAEGCQLRTAPMKDYTFANPVINLQNGIIYSSVKHAAIAYGVMSKDALEYRLKGKTKNNTPFVYA